MYYVYPLREVQYVNILMKYGPISNHKNGKHGPHHLNKMMVETSYICCNLTPNTINKKTSRDLMAEWHDRLTVDQCSKGAKVHGIPASCK